MKYLNTQEYVLIKDIKRDGTIVTQDGKYICIMEVSPQNFNNKDDSEQYQIMSKYERFIKKFPELSFRIKVVTQAMQTDTYVQSFRNAEKFEKNAKVREMIEDHIQFARNESSLSSIDRRFYLIFSYDPENPVFTKTTEEEILTDLAKARNIVRQDFAAMGNPIIEWKDPMHDVANFIYNFFNKRLMHSQNMDVRLERMIKDYKEVYNVTSDDDLPLIDIRDITASKSIRNEKRDYIVINGQFYSFLHIDGSDYPASISPFSWLSNLINFGMGFDVDVFYEKLNRKETLSNLKWKKKFTKTRAEEAKYDDENYETVQEVERSVEMLQDAIRKDRENVYLMYVLITVSADNKQLLYDKIDSLKNIAIDYDCTIRLCDMLQKEGFYSAMPYNDLHKKIKEKAHHNITTSGVVAAYPFISPSLSDKDGVMMGVSKEMDALIIYNAFNTRRQPNANVSILGRSGAGKTYTLLAYTTRQRLLGVQNFIFAPDKQDEFRPTCKALGGEFIDMSTASKTRINPFDIWPITSDTDNLLYGKVENEKSWLAEKIANLIIWYKFFIPMNSTEEALMQEITYNMYEKKSITMDNNSIYQDKEKKILKEMPTFSDLVNEIAEFRKSHSSLREDFEIVFSQYTKNALKNMDGQTNVDLNNKYIVFGFEGFKDNDNLMAPLMFIVLEFVMGKIRSDKTQPKIVSLDEGWMLLDENNKQVASFVINIFRTIRAYNGGVIFSTQSIGDLYNAGEKVAGAILANSPSHILLGMEASDVDKIQSILKLSDEECMNIMSFDRGNALLCGGRNHIPLNIITSPKEQRLYTTDAKTLKEKLRQMAKEDGYDYQ